MPTQAAISARLGESLLRTLLFSITDSIVMFDDDGRILLLNSGGEKLFGYSSDEMLGKNFKSLIPLPIQDAHDGHHQLVGTRCEVIAKHKDQSTFRMCLSVNKGEFEGKSIFVGVMNDLTDHNLDQVSRKNEHRLQTMLDTVSDAIVTVSDSGLVGSFGRAASDLFGYSAAEVVGHPVTMLMPSPYHDKPFKYFERLRTGDKHERATGGRVAIGQRRDGSAFPMEISIGTVIDQKHRQYTLFIRDITGRAGTEQRLEQLQAELLRVSRLDAMGQMTLAIAHELNQPLSAIANYVNAAKRGLGSGQVTPTTARSAIELMEQASVQTMRAAAIIKGLRSFVEKRDVTRQSYDLGQIVEESLALAFVSASASGVKVTLKLDRSLRAVLVDKIQIQQVLFNLIRNSLEAMLSSERRELTLTTQTWSDSFAEISVEDTGPGLSDEVAKQLFKPFVTSKQSGMGVGLTICQAIVEAHGGRIWLVQSDSSGTTFRFRLPMPKAAGV